MNSKSLLSWHVSRHPNKESDHWHERLFFDAIGDTGIPMWNDAARYGQKRFAILSLNIPIFLRKCQFVASGRSANVYVYI